MMGKGLIASGLCVLMATAFGFGQSYQGGVRGAVSDSSGALVPNTKIVLIDESTKVSRSTLTNAEGAYVFNSLDPSTYTISAEAPGFKKLERQNVVIGTQQFLTLD